MLGRGGGKQNGPAKPISVSLTASSPNTTPSPRRSSTRRASAARKDFPGNCQNKDGPRSIRYWDTKLKRLVFRSQWSTRRTQPRTARLAGIARPCPSTCAPTTAPQCGVVLDRDVNAAINISVRGQQQLLSLGSGGTDSRRRRAIQVPDVTPGSLPGEQGRPDTAEQHRKTAA